MTSVSQISLLVTSITLIAAGAMLADSPPRLKVVEVVPPTVSVRQAIADRPIEEKERRFAIAPLMYVNDLTNREAYGLDLPEPSYEQCYLSEPSSAYPVGTKKMRVVRLVDRQCWGLLLTHPKWQKVAAHGAIPVLTVPGFVQTK